MNAYLIARSPGFLEAVRIRLGLIEAAIELGGPPGESERTGAMADLRARWDAAPWGRNVVDAALDRRFERAVGGAVSV